MTRPKIQSIKPFGPSGIVFLMLTSLLIGCAEDKESPPSPQAQPPKQETPSAPSEKPEPPPQKENEPDKKTEGESKSKQDLESGNRKKQNEAPTNTRWQMCEAERQWALKSGLIDINQYRIFRNRNMAPIYLTPGERQSGIDGWFECEKALSENGFLEKTGANQPTAAPVHIQEEPTVNKVVPPPAKETPKELITITPSYSPDPKPVAKREEVSATVTSQNASPQPSQTTVPPSLGAPKGEEPKPNTAVVGHQPDHKTPPPAPKKDTVTVAVADQPAPPLAPQPTKTLPSVTETAPVADQKKVETPTKAPEPVPTPETPTVTPVQPSAPENDTPKEPPRENPPSEKKTDNRAAQRLWQMCEEERKWALEAELIDRAQYRLFRNRNMAPIYVEPGVRQSGIDGWFECTKALKTNGFIRDEIAMDDDDLTILTDDAKVSLIANPPTRIQSVQRPNDNALPEKNWRMCEEERLWAFQLWRIDWRQYRLFKNRNLAPIYRTPGDWRSGIEGWFPCTTALYENGFIDEEPQQFVLSMNIETP
jgi:hypothetical protein